MKTNHEYRIKNRVGRDLILMYGPAVRSQEAFGAAEYDVPSARSLVDQCRGWTSWMLAQGVLNDPCSRSAGTVTQCIAHHFRAQDHYRPLQLLLDHRYDLSQFPQPAFETCLVDPKVAASELGPRVHRQCAAAFGLLDIADHDRVRKSQ